MQEDLLRCPKCGSAQINVDKKGFSGKKAVAGAVMFGVIGAAAGTIGQNKVQLTCLNCGERFKPGEQLKGKKTKLKFKEFLILVLSLGDYISVKIVEKSLL